METVAERTSRDAVVVVPGIMGSELVEARSGRVLWGLSDMRWYVRAWTSDDSLARLRVTDAERAGETTRVVATRLLRFPAFAPFLRGFEPYSALLTGVRQAAVHPDAVTEFAYDWRLSVAHNAALLAEAAEKHLAAWRAHREGSRYAQLVLVAHSMGGLLARHFTESLGGDRDVRTTVTMGTPFYGSVQAVTILGNAGGKPFLPRRRLRDLALSLPGLYDLLPAYRCIEDGVSTRLLTSDDVATIGGDRELAQRSFRTFAGNQANLRTVVGVDQPTMQSLVLQDGTVRGKPYLRDERRLADHLINHGGDGTVYRDSAEGGAQPAYLSQSHGGLAKSPEAIAHVRAVVSEDRLGPPMGAGGLGLDLPDVVPVGHPCEVVVTGVGDPAAVTCRVTDAATGTIAARLKLTMRDGRVVASARLPESGVYRMEFKAHGTSATSQLVMAVPAGTTGAG